MARDATVIPMFNDRRPNPRSGARRGDAPPASASWGGLIPGDRVVGLDRAKVTSVRHTTYYGDPVEKPVTQGKTVLTFDHPERGTFTRTEHSNVGDVSHYRKKR